MLTKEQLLQPRYRVIAGYPDSKFKVGDIIELTIENPYVALNGSSSYLVYYETELKKYPHLFAPAHWSEQRTKEEFPEYLAFQSDEGPEEIYKVSGLSINGAGFVSFVQCEEEEEDFWPAIYHRPATQEEYEAYQQSKQQS